MSDLGDQLGSMFDSATVYELPDSGDGATFELMEGGPVAFRFGRAVSAVSLELEGPGKVVVPSRSTDEPRSYVVSGDVDLQFDDFTECVGLELDGPGTVRVRTNAPPPYRANG